MKTGTTAACVSQTIVKESRSLDGVVGFEVADYRGLQQLWCLLMTLAVIARQMTEHEPL